MFSRPRRTRLASRAACWLFSQVRLLAHRSLCCGWSGSLLRSQHPAALAMRCTVPRGHPLPLACKPSWHIQLIRGALRVARAGCGCGVGALGEVVVLQSSLISQSCPPKLVCARPVTHEAHHLN